MNIEKRIGLACFLGAAIGALLALQFGQYWSMLGVVIGGIVGYLAYDFKGVVRGIVKVWVSSVNYPLRQKLPKILKICAAVLYFLIPGFLWSMLILYFYIKPTFIMWGTDWNISTVMITIIFSLTAGFFHGIAMTVANRNISDTKILNSYVIHLNPLTVIFVWLPLIIFLTVPKVWPFIKKVIIEIHSDIRLLCMTDAMIGALVGYCLGSALVGGVVGALSGILNYKLVSIKWLKLTPKTATY